MSWNNYTDYDRMPESACEMAKKVVVAFREALTPLGVTVEDGEPTGHAYKGVKTPRPSFNLVKGKTKIHVNFVKDGVDSVKKPFHLEFSTPHNWKRMKVRGFVAPECTVTPTIVESLVEVIREAEAKYAKQEVEYNLLHEASEALKAVGIECNAYRNYREARVSPDTDGTCRVEFYGNGERETAAKTMSDMVASLLTRFGNVVAKVDYSGCSTTYLLRFPRGRVPETKDAVDMLAAVYEKKPNA